MSTELLPTTSGGLALQVLRRHAAAFAEHAPHASDDSDPEHVHQARVATRRMRAALRLFNDVLVAERLSGLDDELRWIASQLGAVRDLDVQVRRLQDVGAQLGTAAALAPYGAWLEEQRQRALTSLDDAIKSVRFKELSERLDQLAAIEPDPRTDRPLDEDAPPRLRSAYRKLRKAAQGLVPDSPPPAFHKARIRAKRLRYATEFMEPLYGKPARRLIENTVALQDLLGNHQDSIVSVQRIDEAVQTVGGGWPTESSVAIGRVVQWEAQYGEQLRGRFQPTFREVEDAWTKLRRAL